MKLPTYEGNDIEEAATQFAELQKEAEQLVAFSKNRIVEIEVGGEEITLACHLPACWGTDKRCQSDSGTTRSSSHRLHTTLCGLPLSPRLALRQPRGRRSFQTSTGSWSV